MIPVGTPVRLGARRAGPKASDPFRASGLLSGPAPARLADRFERVHTDLRISITDRCNFRCTYCMPEEGMVFSPRSELMTAEEIERVAAVARRLGVTSVRVTGGEPLLRGDVVEIVSRLAAIGFEDIALTTNASRLGRLAVDLRRAGLKRCNVSCDSLRPERFAAIRRRGKLSEVLASMDAAEEAGFPPVKVNVVLAAGINDDEVLDFAEFARRTGRPVRFIELMPLGADGPWSRAQVVPSADVIAQIAERWPIEPWATPGAAADLSADHAPATRYRFVDGRGEVGVIPTVTEPFCGTCNRLRLTADGSIRNCLFSDDEVQLRDALRRGCDDDEIALALGAAVAAKRAGHGIDEPGFLRPARTMSRIGG